MRTAIATSRRTCRLGSQPIINFVNAILGREEVQSKPENALRITAFTEAAWQSAAQGGVPVPIAQLEE
jgi:hypothetical protein